MKKITMEEVYSIYAVYNNNFVEYYIRENEGQHDFALQLFEKLKTENTKHFSILPYSNPEYADPILEYDKDDDEEYMYIIPKDALFDNFEIFEDFEDDEE